MSFPWTGHVQEINGSWTSLTSFICETEENQLWAKVQNRPCQGNAEVQVQILWHRHEHAAKSSSKHSSSVHWTKWSAFKQNKIWLNRIPKGRGIQTPGSVTVAAFSSLRITSTRVSGGTGCSQCSWSVHRTRSCCQGHVLWIEMVLVIGALLPGPFILQH